MQDTPGNLAVYPQRNYLFRPGRETREGSAGFNTLYLQSAESALLPFPDEDDQIRNPT